MNIINANSADIGIKSLSDDIIVHISRGDNVLWLISGGSNIEIEVQILNILKRALSAQSLKRLTVTLTDERFGPVGHENSNWSQLEKAGFDFSCVNAIPILVNDSISNTTHTFIENITRALSDSRYVIGQFGIGEDGHVAGILPESRALHTKKLACGYVSKPYTRITIAPAMFKRIDCAYTFVSGDKKRVVVEKLQTDIEIDLMPAQLLKLVPESYLYLIIK